MADDHHHVRARHATIALRVEDSWAPRSTNRELEGNGFVGHRDDATVGPVSPSKHLAPVTSVLKPQEGEP